MCHVLMGHCQVEYYSWKLENRYQRNLAYKVCPQCGWPLPGWWLAQSVCVVPVMDLC